MAVNSDNFPSQVLSLLTENGCHVFRVKTAVWGKKDPFGDEKNTLVRLQAGKDENTNTNECQCVSCAHIYVKVCLNCDACCVKITAS